MAYRVIWRLIGREGRHLDGGPLEGFYSTYSEAVAAVSELLSPYCEVSRDHEQGSWLARRSPDADLSLSVWIEHADESMPDGVGGGGAADPAGGARAPSEQPAEAFP